MFAEILTDRLTLRDLVPSDAPRIFEYRSHPDISRFQLWGTESVAAIQSYIFGLSEHKASGKESWYQLGIVLRSSGQLIGDCGFHILEDEPRQTEIGIALAPEFQGRGYATEALRALLDYLFAGIEMHRVFGSVDPRNGRSMNLLRRLGMRKEAHHVKSLWFKGEWVDDVIFAITAGEWNGQHHANHSVQRRVE